MLDLENLLQSIRIRLIRWTLLELFQGVSAKAKYKLAPYFYLAVEEHYNRPSRRFWDFCSVGCS